MTDFQDDCERHINLTPDGAIKYQSILQKMYPDADWDGLFRIIEDNIVDDERIAWTQVWREWLEMPK